MSARISNLTQPEIKHFTATDKRGIKHNQVMMTSTKEVTCQVIASIVPDGNGGYLVHSAVQYALGSEWYGKPARCTFSFADALHVAYGQARKLYAVTASRAIAGLLYDGVVPATEDIEC